MSSKVSLESLDLALSFVMGFSSEAPGGPWTVNPFSLKFDFRRKFMVFQKKFFAQIKELEKLNITVDFNKRCQVCSRKSFFSRNSPYPWVTYDM